MTTFLDWLANENIFFTKSAITSECHNTFWWNKKQLFELMTYSNNAMSLSWILIFWQSLWPNFYPKYKMVKVGPKLLDLKCPFPPFLQIIFGVFVETFLKTVHTFLMGHILKFPAKKKFLQGGLRGPEIAQSKVGQNCIFVKIIYTYLLEHFP